MKNIIKHNKTAGITLIALVITIIVLLILAGITVAQLSNNGLFESTKLAKEKYKNSSKKEDIDISQYSNSIESYINGNRDFKIEKVEITDVASGWSVTNNSVRIGDLIFINFYFYKNSQWTVGWNNNIAKISAPAKMDNCFDLLEGYNGSNKGEFRIETNGAIDAYITCTWPAANDFVKCNGVYYIGE